MEEENILEEILEKVEENNKILRSIRSEKRWSKFFKFLYIGALVIFSIFIWSKIKPVFDSFSDSVEKVSEIKKDVEEKSNFFKDFFSK